MGNGRQYTERLAAVGQLAAGAAHEINNPLAIISARTQLLESRETDEKKRRDLHQISEQIERISSILLSLMGFARPNAPQVTKVDLNALLQKIVGLVDSIFHTHRIPIVQNLSPVLPLILADANQLEQVFRIQGGSNRQPVIMVALLCGRGPPGQNVLIRIEVDDEALVPREDYGRRQ